MEQHSNNQHSKWIQGLFQNREFMPAAVNLVNNSRLGISWTAEGDLTPGQQTLFWVSVFILVDKCYSSLRQRSFSLQRVRVGLETYGSSRCWELVVLSVQSLNRTFTHHLECLKNIEEEGWKERKIWKKGQRVARCYLWAWHDHCNHYLSYTEWAHTRPDFSMIHHGWRKAPVSLSLPAELLDADGF